MKLEYQSAVIFCNDLSRQREFYEEFLGQQLEQDLGSCLVFKNRFALWKLTDKYPVVKELGYTYEHIGNRNLELCFETDEFEDAVEKVLMSDLRILHNVVEEQWGQYTIRFYDPEGNLVEIGESMRCFVRRMHGEGLTESEIADKTGIPGDMVRQLLD